MVTRIIQLAWKRAYAVGAGCRFVENFKLEEDKENIEQTTISNTRSNKGVFGTV